MNFKRPILLVSALTLAAAAVFAGTSAQKTTLKFSPPKGKNYGYIATTSSKAAAGAPGMSMSQKMDMTMSILGPAPKGTKVRVKINSVNTTIPGMSGSQGNQMNDALKGSSMEMILDSRGRVVGTPTSSNPQMTRMMAQVGTSSGVLGVEFPAGPVGPGSTWKTSVDFGKLMGAGMPGMRATGSSKVPVSFKLVRFESKGGKRLAVIASTIKGTVNMAAGQGAQAMNMKFTMNMAGSTSVDVATGMPVSASTNGTVDVSLGQGGSMKQTISSTLKAK